MGTHFKDIVIKSPNNSHKAILKLAGEIRFGPRYYSLCIDDMSFGKRIFGDAYLWSHDSKYFAIQEWKTTDYGEGPQTQLLLINITDKMECIISSANKGFIVPKLFKDHKIIYTKEYKGQGIIKEYEMEYRNLNRWSKL
jgi:hypothetical protein